MRSRSASDSVEAAKLWADDGVTVTPLNPGRIWGTGLGRHIAGYVAAKHGAAGLTKTAALDYGRLGIRVNTVATGLVDTPLVATGCSPEVMAARIAAHPLGRIAQPQEIADAIVWLCSPQSSFVTGAVIPVSGGYTVQ